VHTSSLIKKLLNVKDIIVEWVKFETQEDGEEILVVKGIPPKRKRNRCPICGRKSAWYDSKHKVIRCRSLDLGETRVYIESTSRRVQCKKHGVRVAAVPWARSGARFTYGFDNAVTRQAMNSSTSVVAKMMRIEWNTVGHIVKRVYDDVKGAIPSMFDGLTCIGIDETSYKKGHKYMTVVVDHMTGRLIWAYPKHGKEVLTKFFEMLTPEQRKSIRHVTADGARWIADCVKEYCPNAERSIDPFHVVQWVTETLDEVRKDVWNAARKKSKIGRREKECWTAQEERASTEG
jgi:transposase